jgi:hypothetical protein
LDSQKYRNKPVLPKTLKGEVDLPLLLFNVSIFIKEFMDKMFQPLSLPFSISGKLIVSL